MGIFTPEPTKSVEEVEELVAETVVSADAELV